MTQEAVGVTWMKKIGTIYRKNSTESGCCFIVNLQVVAIKGDRAELVNQNLI